MNATGTRYRVNALAKGLRVLTVFSERRTALALKDIVEITGMPMPTAFRLVTTLVDEGYLQRLPDGSYTPGPAVLSLGFAALQGNDVVQASRNALETLAAVTGETVNLGQLRGADVLYLARIRRETSLVTANVHVGSALSAVYSSMGKALLAYLAEDDLQELLRQVTIGAGSWGPNAVRDESQLRAQLQAARENRFAVQDQEVAVGLRSIAGPVWDNHGRVVAAINIATGSADWPIERMVDKLAPPLLSACEDAARRLGAVPGSAPQTTARAATLGAA